MQRTISSIRIDTLSSIRSEVRIDDNVSQEDGEPTVINDTKNHPASMAKLPCVKKGLSNVSAGSTLTGAIPEPVDKYESNNFFRLHFFQSAMFATILEDGISAMRILEECNNEIRVTLMNLEMIFHLRAKYGVEPPEVDDELDEVDPKKLGCLEYTLYKLGRDRKDVLDTFSNTYVALTVMRSFRPLWHRVWESVEMDNHSKSVHENHVKHKMLHKEAMKNLRQKRNQNRRLMYDIDTRVCELRSAIEDSVLTCELRGRYIDKWQTARTEQHQVIIEQKESTYSENIDSSKLNMEKESRVHHEITMHTATIISEKLKAVDDLMNKYDRDMEAIDLKIQVKMSNYQEILERRQEMEKKYADHAKLIMEWVKFKNDREKAQRYARNMNNSAVIVQAWWRGILVRMKLGPFRPVKKKPGGKGKKK